MQCKKKFFHNGVTPISLDDDQYELRSIKNADLCIPHKHNPCKRYGCIMDCCCSFSTGAIIIGNLVADGQTGPQSFSIQMVLLKQGFHILSNSIALDRGYSCLHNVNAAADVGLRQNGCITVTCSPFKPIDPLHPPTASNFYISQSGFASAYYARYLLMNGTRMIICCFRNGSDKLVHMQTAESESTPWLWDWEHLGLDSPPPLLTPSEKEQWANFLALEQRCVRLTKEQGTPDWHQMRKFGVSGTTAHNVVAVFFRLHGFSDQSSISLLEQLGFKQDAPVVPTDASVEAAALMAHVYTDKQMEDLTIAQMKAILVAFRISLLQLLPNEASEKGKKGHYLSTLKHHRVSVPNDSPVLASPLFNGSPVLASPLFNGSPVLASPTTTNALQLMPGPVLPVVRRLGANPPGPRTNAASSRTTAASPRTTASPLSNVLLVSPSTPANGPATPANGPAAKYTFTLGPLPAPSLPPQQIVEQLLLKSWFHNKKTAGGDPGDSGAGHSFLAGHLNEAKLRVAIAFFLALHYRTAVIYATRLYGLLELEPGIVVSPDGVVDMAWNPPVTPRSLVLMEFKTKVEATSITEALSLAQMHGAFVSCAFNSGVCKTLICREHRVQILHQVAVTGILDVMYVVATKTKIIQVVRVSFEEKEKEDWIQIIRTIITRCVPWILQKPEVLQLPEIPSHQPHPGSLYGGCPDKETLMLHVFIHRKYAHLIRERGYPLPTALRIVPFPITFWNKTKGMTDCLSRVLNNVKPPIQSLAPYGCIWIRMLMMMVYNAHILSRLFAIEARLKIPGSIICLEQLRQALNSEASFRDSIAKLIRSGGFKFTNLLFSSCMGVPLVLPVAAVCGAAPNLILGKLTTTSKSKTKVEFMNSAEGLNIRRRNGAHVIGVDQKHLGSCMLCGARTQMFCTTCSKACCGKNNESVQFYVCTTPSRAAVGQRLNISSCFQMMHSADKLLYDPGRQKCTTENHLQSLSAMNATNAAKRIRIADNGATQPQDGATAAQSQDAHDGASQQDGASQGNESETEGHAGFDAMDDDGI